MSAVFVAINLSCAVYSRKASYKINQAHSKITLPLKSLANYGHGPNGPLTFCDLFHHLLPYSQKCAIIYMWSSLVPLLHMKHNVFFHCTETDLKHKQIGK